MLDWAIREAESLALPCYDLEPASNGDVVSGYWGGTRSDLPENLPAFVGAIRSTEHILSVDSAVPALDLKGRGPFALSLENDERRRRACLHNPGFYRIAGSHLLERGRPIESHRIDLVAAAGGFAPLRRPRRRCLAQDSWTATLGVCGPGRGS